jgi:exopolysaccharide biosynthesis protein
VPTPARLIVFLLPLLLAFAGPAPVRAEPPAVAPTDSLETASQTRPVAPGLSLTSFDRYGGDGWLRADALTADLSGGLRVGYLNAGAVAATAPLRQLADPAGAVAAVNGDFFDINNSGAAQGVGVRDGELVQSPVAGHDNAVAITAEGIGGVVETHFEGSATGPAGEPVPLSQFNNLVQPGGVGLFTSLWGSYPRDRAITGAGEVAEVVLEDGVVVRIDDQPGSGPIPAGGSVLLGREAGAAALAELAVGDPVTVTYDLRTSGGGTEPATAIGGRTVLVRDGVPQPAGGGTPEPRTAMGFSADGQTMYVLTVDGRQVDSRGVTLTELAELMAELGADDALELDGGGSSTLAAREPGAGAVQVENSPSDGSERSVPNGLAFYAPAGSGHPDGFWVETTADPAAAPGLDPVPGGRPDRVFPGLTRQLTAAGYDETYAPTPANPRWRSTPAEQGRVEAGVFRAGAPGAATVTAQRGGARGSLELTVLDPLARIAPTSPQLSLSGVDGEARFGVVGSDASGHTAPIEPADVSLTYDDDLLKVVGADDGWFAVTAPDEVGATTITATVGDVRTQLPVTVGLEEVVVADFSDADQWWYSSVPADVAGSVEPAPGRDGRAGLRLSADFSRHTVTRAAYANPPEWIDVPGQPQGFVMGIHAAGNAEWPSLHLVDANGSSVVLRGPNLTWSGWREVRFDVPPGVAYPVRIRRFYAPEIRAGAQYRSEWVIDEIAALVPPEVDLPERPVVPDPVVGTGADVAGAAWRFAVMADAQFTSDDPDSDIVAQTRRTLREIRAADPDFLVINGDFVDRALPADLALAKRILDEELAGELPYYYVPGNHEIMGAPITNFEAVFGATYRVFDHRGTRFVTLNSATGLLRSDFDQLRALRGALDGAAGDPSVGSVVVMHHHPPRDVTPAAPSQLSDRKEAALVEEWLAEFQRATGKQALFIGAHAGYVHGSHVDGVPYLIVGNSGKGPATPPDQGGFTGWALVGVDPDRVRVQVRPHVDALSLDVAETAPLGEPVPVTATVAQGGVAVPARWPVSVDWTGSPGVHVGPESGVRPRHVGWFDPATGSLTALRSFGTVVLSATVNGETATARVRLTDGVVARQLGGVSGDLGSGYIRNSRTQDPH